MASFIFSHARNLPKTKRERNFEISWLLRIGFLSFIYNILTFTITLYLSKAIIIMVHIEVFPNNDPVIPYKAQAKGPVNKIPKNKKLWFTQIGCSYIQFSRSAASCSEFVLISPPFIFFYTNEVLTNLKVFERSWRKDKTPKMMIEDYKNMSDTNWELLPDV